MNTVKRRSMVLPFLIIVICGGALIAGLLRGRPDGGLFAAGSAGDKEHSTSVKAEGIDSLDIGWINGGVEIRAADGDEIKVTEYSNKNLNKKDMFYTEVKGGVLSVNWRKSSVKNIIGINLLKKDLLVELPRKLAENLESLDCGTVSGSIDAAELRSGKMEFSSTSGGIDIESVSTEKLDITTVSGHINVSEAQCSKIGMFTTSGSIAVDGIESEDMDFTTVSGSVEIDGSFSGQIDGSTTSASVDIETDVCPERVDLGTVSGHFRLAVPDGTGFTAKYSSVSGSFNSDFPTVSEKNGDNKTEVYLDGKSRFDFSSVSGGIEIAESRAVKN